jgi:hypothetical protein
VNKEIEYTTYSWVIHEITDNSYNRWAIHAIRFIWEKEGWEESQDHMFEKFFEDQIDTIYEWLDGEKYKLNEKGLMEEI